MDASNKADLDWMATHVPHETDTPTFTITPTFTGTLTPTAIPTAAHVQLINRIGASCMGDLAFKVGSPGSDPGQFYNPYNIATDKNGNIYVSDSSNDRVQVFDSNGGFLFQFGSSGSGPGQFTGVSGIAIDKLGNILVCDRSNSRVEVFDPNGNYTTKFSSLGSGVTQLNTPYGIAIDYQGYIYVVDNNNIRISKWNDAYSHVANLNVSGFMLDPYGIAIAGNYIYLTEYTWDWVGVLDMAGNLIRTIGSTGSGHGQFDSPQGICLDNKENIYVSEADNHRVQKLDNAGNFLCEYFGQFDYQLYNPRDVKIDKFGRLLIVDGQNGAGSFQVLNPSQQVYVDNMAPLSTPFPTATPTGTFYTFTPTNTNTYTPTPSYTNTTTQVVVAVNASATPNLNVGAVILNNPALATPIAQFTQAPYPTAWPLATAIYPINTPAPVTFVGTPFVRDFITDADNNTNTASVFIPNTQANSVTIGARPGILINADLGTMSASNIWVSAAMDSTSTDALGTHNSNSQLMINSIGRIYTGANQLSRLRQVDAVSNTATALGVQSIDRTGFLFPLAKVTTTGAQTPVTYIQGGLFWATQVLSSGASALTIDYFGGIDGTNYPITIGSVTLTGNGGVTFSPCKVPFVEPSVRGWGLSATPTITIQTWGGN